MGLDPETPLLLGQRLPVSLCHQMALEGEPKVRRERTIFFLFFFFPTRVTPASLLVQKNNIFQITADHPVDKIKSICDKKLVLAERIEETVSSVRSL